MTFCKFEILFLFIFICFVVYVVNFYLNILSEQKEFKSKQKAIRLKIKTENTKREKLKSQIEISNDLIFSMQDKMFTINNDLIQIIKSQNNNV